MQFVSDLDAELLPYLRKLPTYSGSWIDQVHGGLVAMVTAVTSELQRDLEFLRLTEAFVEG